MTHSFSRFCALGMCAIAAGSCADPVGYVEDTPVLPTSAEILDGTCPDCDARKPTPAEMESMEDAINSRDSCPELQKILREMMASREVLVHDDQVIENGQTVWGTWYWNGGDSRVYVYGGHWDLPADQFPSQLSETLYHEGAHEQVGTGHNHDSLWQDAFSCYAT